MPGWTDTQTPHLPSAGPRQPERFLSSLNSSPETTPTSPLPDEQAVLRTHLRAVIESLRQERERLAESRRSIDSAVTLRVQQMEEQWARERDATYRQLALAALTQARLQVDNEQAAQARAVELARAELERERHELEALRQTLEPAAAALREQQAKFDRDRRAWEEYRQRQQDELERMRQHALSLPPRPGEPLLPVHELDERQEVTQMKTSEFDNWYAEKLAGLRQMMSAGRSAAASEEAA